MTSADIARDMDALPQAMGVAEQFFAGGVEDPKVRYAVELAIEEIFTNMVKYNSGGRGPIRIEIDQQDAVITLRFEDPDGPPFDPLRDAPPFNPAQALEGREPGGLGLHLVKQMMDRIEYSHHDRTSTITLYKRVP
jgi:anti-sigma regulatory factor (Ser/Thr protein kinase)